MSKKIKIIFYGGVGTTTGANIMLEYDNQKILIDCGILQGVKTAEDKNLREFKYDPKKVGFLLLTHAHMDHIGRVPKLVRDGFRGRIISTLETKELALPMLEDALKVMKIRHPDSLMFDERDIEKTFEIWEGKHYGEKIKLSEDCFLEMMDAGHVLGSAIINIEINGKKIAFTGDLGNSPSPLLPDNQVPKGVDYMVMESVYGDRNHESKQERREKLKQVLTNGIKRGGTIIIPAFSIERTQVLLYEINNMIEDGEISKVPVFLDSPLALKVTNVYQKYTKDFKASVQKEIKSGDDIFDFPGLKIINSIDESNNIKKTEGAKIILAGSGMSEGGRVISHEAHYLPDPKATILFVGYQSVGSLGRAIADGAKEVFIDTDNNRKNGKEKVKVRATIDSIGGYSSHKDSENLVKFVEEAADFDEKGKTKLKKVFVIMGEPKASLFLSQRVHDYLDIDAIYPEEGREYILE